jgi:hypothetical protein
MGLSWTRLKKSFVLVLSWTRLKKSFLEFPAIFKHYSLLFVGMIIVNLFFTQSMIYLQELRMTSKDDVYIPVMLVLALVGFIVQSIIRVAWTFMICHFFKNGNSLQDFLRQHLEQGLIESLRAFFRAVLWGFVFIFPGFHRFFQYQFVLYVVGLDEKYDKDQVDALTESVRLSRGHMFGISTLIVIFGLLSLFCTSGYFITDRPLQVLAVEAAGFVLVIVQTIYFLHLFQDIRAEKAPRAAA